MTKKELFEQLSETHNITQGRAERIFNEIFAKITTDILTEGRYNIRNFGTFRTKKRAARTVTSPIAGTVDVPARMTIVFKPSPELKEKISGAAL